jgi:hypothetical protein
MRSYRLLHWGKSTRSTDMRSKRLTPTCRWRKSSYSGDDGNCVEVASTGDGVAVRDSNSGSAGPVLTFSLDEWDAFIRGAKSGEFDRY